MRRVLLILLVSLAGAWGVRTYVFETISVASGSMEPTLQVGLHFLVNKLAYRSSEPERGDIIVFTDPLDNALGMIKRVIAVSGDTVEMRDKKVYVNAQPLDEPYAVYKRQRERLDGDTMGPLVVPAKHVFVLGDNRDESDDSSVWKDPKTGDHLYFLPDELIKGKLLKLQ